MSQKAAASPATDVKHYEGQQAYFIVAEWSGSNTSCLRPYGRYVLVRMDECAPYSKGGVVIPPAHVERMSMSSESGCVYAVGAEAYRTYDDGKLWTGPKPVAGDRVFVLRHSGMLARGRDGFMYRFMEPSCIAGGLDPEYEEDEAA